ncbi:hypothetical protein N0V87_005708 [Didymella glomerata]|uniref:Uncharacterized protein n=1 Tax=Didymella glomerata TaxID=749621 RepID=A0A9W8WY42_9PLEO|nr:hypothetical protein N0V87_005708 [Didymella glomerata]
MVIGEPGVETVTSKSMKFCYDGPLGQWDGLDDGVDIFLKEIQAAFERCKGVPTDITQSVEHLNPDFATAEHLQVGSEIDLDGRFKNNVVSKARSVLMTLTNPKFADGREPTDLPALPRSFKFGSSKVFAAALRPIGSELDKVFKIPGDGPDQQVRLICELKSCSTVNIAEMIKRGTESCEKDSFRNLIGQVVRDMLKWRVKYAIVSTYKETVFLKIDRAHSDPSHWGVYYSRGIINSSDKATLDHTVYKV